MNNINTEVFTCLNMYVYVCVCICVNVYMYICVLLLLTIGSTSGKYSQNNTRLDGQHKQIYLTDTSTYTHTYMHIYQRQEIKQSLHLTSQKQNSITPKNISPNIHTHIHMQKIHAHRHMYVYTANITCTIQ